MMSLSRCLSLTAFVLAVGAAWQIAQPKAQSTPQTIVSPVGDPFINAASTGTLNKRQLFVAPPEPRKISVDFLQQ